jgi:hypothetical protein
MSCNGEPFRSFAGVSTVVIQAQRAGTDQFTFHLTHGDTVTAAAAGATFQQPGPSAGATGIELSPRRPADSVSAKAAGHPLAHLHNDHGGLTIQTDTELTVAVNRPTTDVVDFKVDKVVEPEWNGGMVHSITGVATIVVNTRNASKIRSPVPIRARDRVAR